MEYSDYISQVATIKNPSGWGHIQNPNLEHITSTTKFINLHSKEIKDNLTSITNAPTHSSIKPTTPTPWISSITFS